MDMGCGGQQGQEGRQPKANPDHSESGKADGVHVFPHRLPAKARFSNLAALLSMSLRLVGRGVLTPPSAIRTSPDLGGALGTARPTPVHGPSARVSIRFGGLVPRCFQWNESQPGKGLLPEGAWNLAGGRA